MTATAQTNFNTLSPLTTFGSYGDGSIHPGDQPYVTGQSTSPYTGRDFQRGFAYDPVTGNVIINDRQTNGANSTPYMTGNIHVLNGITGAEVATSPLPAYGTNLDGTAILTNGPFVTHAVAVADDGVVYVCSLVNASAIDAFKIYRWESSTTTNDPVLAYNGNPGGAGFSQSWGINLVARGAWTNTQLLAGSRTFQGLPGTNVAVFTTVDGSNFTATVLAMDAPQDSFGRAGGIAFGAGNTFWGKPGGNTNTPSVLRHMSFDLVTSNATTLQVFDTSVWPSSVTLAPLAVDPTNNLLAAVDFQVGIDHVRLYDISNLGIPPVLLDIKDFPVSTADTTTGFMQFGGGHLYVHNMNNGILSFNVDPGPGVNTAPAIVTQPAPAAQKVAQGGAASYEVFAYRAAGYRWMLNGVVVPGATNSTLSLTNVLEANEGDYQVVVTNSAGSVTSSVVHLTVIFPDDYPHLSQTWSLAPGSRPYVTRDASNTPFQRSVAYNVLSNQLIIVSRTNVSQQANTNGLTVNVVDAATGADLYMLPTSGLFSAANNNSICLLNIAATDDGVVYAANCAYTAGSAVGGFRLYRWDNSGSDTLPLQVYGPADPAGQSTTIRWGDAMALRGVGTNTEIIVDSNPGTLAALLTTADGTNFTTGGGLTSFFRTNSPGGSIGRSLQFDSTSTNRVWQKRKGLRLDLGAWEFDPASPNYRLDIDVTNYTGLPSGVGPVVLDLTNKLMAGIEFATVATTPDTVNLYEISDLSTPLLLGKYPFPTNHQANANFIGQVIFAGNRVFAVDGNNGIVAFTIVPPLTPTLSVTQSGPDVLIFWTNSVSGWVLQGTPTLVPSAWLDLTNSVSSGQGQNIVKDSPIGTKFYRLRKPKT